MKRLLLVAAIALISVGPAKAWNCPSGQIRQQAPAGTPTSTPFYDIVEGIAFICVPNTPPTSPNNSSQTQSQQQSQNTNVSNTNSNSNVNSTKSASNSNSNSSASSNANSKNTLQNKLTNSGNSQNTNTNSVSGGNSSNSVTAQGGAGGASTSQATSGPSSANNNGNGANNSSYSNSTKVEAVASTAFAQASPTVSCFKGIGVGGQTVAGGLSFSGGKIDKNCARLETARSFANFGSRIAYCKVMLTDDYAKKAGVSIDECLNVPVQVVTPVPTPIAAVSPPIQVTVQIPQPEPIPTAPVKSSGVLTYVGDCKLYQYNTCVAFMNQAIRSVQGRQAKIVVYGPLNSGRVLGYLRSKVPASQIEPSLSDDQNDTVTIDIWQAE